MIFTNTIDLCLSQVVTNTEKWTLATPSDVNVGQMARECQVSHLLGQVVRHIFDPTPDEAFHTNEAAQLERTLMALMPILIEEEFFYGKYCAALGMSTWFVDHRA
jgi:hypothetical protein